MSTKQETTPFSAKDLCEVWTKEMTEEIKGALGNLGTEDIAKEDIACVVVVDKNNQRQVYTSHPMKMMQWDRPGEDSSGGGQSTIGWDLTPEGCLWMLTLVRETQGGAWIERSRVCIYDFRKPACPVGTRIPTT